MRYIEWANLQLPAGQQLDTSSNEPFFTAPEVKALVKAHFSKVATRVNTASNVVYKDDPTIMAWELCNACRNTGGPPGVWTPSTRDPAVVSAWYAEMAAYLKTVDPNHLVGTGEEGFDTQQEGAYSPHYSNAYTLAVRRSDG